MSETSVDDERINIAWLYHMEGLTQAEIAERIGISRLMVHRILQKCREDGIVHISIEHPNSRCAKLGADLQKAFGLKYATVIPGSSDDRTRKEMLGKVSARAFGRHVRNGMTIGVGWGSTVAQTARFMHERSHDALTVVSLLGGLTKSAAVNPHEIAWRVADLLGATCYYCAAPAVVDSPASREMILGLENIRTAMALARRASLALLGIGDVSPDSTFAKVGLIDTDEIERLNAQGAVADLIGTFIDVHGKPVDAGINDRTISAGPAALERIENVFAVAGGTDKAKAILAALRTGLIHSLVTDVQAAEQVLFLNGLTQAVD